MQKFVKSICCLLAFVTVFSVAACGEKEKEYVYIEVPASSQESSLESSVEEAVPTYTIQYTDGVGVSSLRVTEGEPFALPSVPKKTGYDFAGLFDAEKGGTQYVSEMGLSLGDFTAGKNLSLYAQFKPKTYNVVLDYQGAAVMGARQIQAEYNASLPDLPNDLVLEHKEFTGWYTEPNGQGVQVYDRYGLVPVSCIVNSKNFTIRGDEEYLYLYAGFETEKYTVTFTFGGGIPDKKIEVAYDTPLESVDTSSVRNGEGFAVAKWTTEKDGLYSYTGTVTADMTLYPLEWSPVIDFDVNGGDERACILARTGEVIELPTTQKELYKFLGWKKADGTLISELQMPATSVVLSAVWQPCLVLHENGGTLTEDIAQDAGTTLSLPKIERENFIFAGWYTDEGKLYDATYMPEESKVLKAGWYEIKKVIKTFIGPNSILIEQDRPSFSLSHTIDMSEILGDHESVEVSVKGYVKMSSKYSGQTGYIDFYSEANISGAYLLGKVGGKTATSYNYIQTEFSMTWKVMTKTIYICYYASDDELCKMKDFYIEITYPEMDTLIL